MIPGSSPAGQRIHEAGLRFQATDAAKAEGRAAMAAQLRAGLPMIVVKPVPSFPEPQPSVVDAVQAALDWSGNGEEPSALPSTPLSSDVFRAVARAHGVSVHDMQANSKNRNLVLARHEAMYRAAVETRLSLPQIGARLGKDHTTVLHGIRRHAERNGLPLPRGMTPDPQKRRDQLGSV